MSIDGNPTRFATLAPVHRRARSSQSVPRTLLAVHAHPDDESSKGAATMARYADEGVRVVVVTCTGGEAGEILNPAMDKPGVLERMPELRRQELAKALEIIDVTAHHWLGYRDSGMADTETNGHPDAFANGDLEVATGRLVAVIRAERPQVVLTYDERGGYPHPDHIRTHEVSVAAFEAAGDPDRFPEAGPPYQPLKLYYHATFSRERMELIHQGAVERGIESPFAEWLERWDEEEDGFPDPVVTAQVDVAAWLGRRRDALIAHATQIDPNSFWFAMPDEVVAEVYPWEDYTLARSLVTVPERETDLFEGIDAEGNPVP
jgi:mycothiol S-conjugate amidase